MTPLQQRFKEAIDEFDSSFKNSTELAKDCEKIAEEFAEEFAEWCNARDLCYLPAESIWESEHYDKRYTTQQLIQQFIYKEQGK